MPKTVIFRPPNARAELTDRDDRRWCDGDRGPMADDDIAIARKAYGPESIEVLDEPAADADEGSGDDQADGVDVDGDGIPDMSWGESRAVAAALGFEGAHPKKEEIEEFLADQAPEDIAAALSAVRAEG